MLAAALAAAAGLGVPHANASRFLQVGIYDDPQVLGNPDRTFPVLKQLRVQVVRVTMRWGGIGGVARRRPEKPTDPADPAYNWAAYDRVVTLAAESRIKVLFSIVGTPGWANGGRPSNRAPRKAHVQVLRVNLYWGGRLGVAKRRPFDAEDPADPAYNWDLYDRLVRYAAANNIKVLFSIYGTPAWENRAGLNRAPKNPQELMKFASAAAIRYAGDYPGPDGDTLPPVRLWLAWNEPNNPVFLSPQYRRVRGRWAIQSAVDYAKICNAVWSGVHATSIAGEKVGCGATAPRGNNIPGGIRPSVSPLTFLRALKKAGLRRFDAYAHHPYYGNPSESPTKRPPTGNAITLGNINRLITELTRLYGRKPLWITEYGYQTKPPDPLFGVSWRRQASWLATAFSVARRNPRIDMMLWFLLRDERRIRGRDGWQSGLLTYGGARKPSYRVFQRLPR